MKKRHGKIFDANDEIKLSPCSLALGQHTIRCNDHLCVQGIRLVLYAARYESSNRKKFSLMENGFKEEKRTLQIPVLVMDKLGFK
ncbi:MAG: hypothetical protein ACLVHE_07265 [Dialister invisus]